MSTKQTSTVRDQGKDLGATMNAATRITMNANTILQQSDIELDEVKDLPAHQKAARSHSNTWLNDVWPSIISITSDIIDYAGTFEASYQTLLGLVDKLKGGDESAKKEFLTVLNQALLPALHKQRERSEKVASDTTSLKGAFQTDYKSFENDYQIAEAAYTGKHGKLVELQGKLKAAQAKVKSLETALIAASAIEGVLLVAAAVVEVATDGAATPLLMTGAVAGAAVDGGILIAYSDAVKDMSNLQVQIDSLKCQLNYLNVVNGQIKGFEGSLNDTAVAAQKVVDGWTALVDDLSKVIGQLDEMTPQDAAILITIHLKAANEDWGVVKQQAEVLQPAGQIPVKNYKDIESFLKDISPKHGA